MLAARAFNHSFFLYIPNTVPAGGGQEGLNLTVTSCNLIRGRINSSPAQRSVPLVHHRVVIAWFPAAFLFFTSAITPHVINEIWKVLLVSYDFWNDTARVKMPPKTWVLPPAPFPLPPPGLTQSHQTVCLSPCSGGLKQRLQSLVNISKRPSLPCHN